MARDFDKMARLLAAPIALALVMSAHDVARAQIAPDSSGPIDITSDAGDFSNSTCESTWRGSAEALQGQSRLRADVIRAFLKPKTGGEKGPQAGAGSVDTQISCGQTDRIEADGNVFYVTPDQIARGDHAVYNVIVLQGKNVVRGDRLTIHVKSRDAVMDSDAKGRGTPGRVRGVFYPSQNGAPGSPQGASAAPGGH
jgi:lipopolysaccharide export system protein LptA